MFLNNMNEWLQDKNKEIKGEFNKCIKTNQLGAEALKFDDMIVF